MVNMSVPNKSLCPTLKGWKYGHLVFDRKRLELREFPWQRHYGYYLVSFVFFFKNNKFKSQFAAILVFFLYLLSRKQKLRARLRAKFIDKPIAFFQEGSLFLLLTIHIHALPSCVFYYSFQKLCDHFYPMLPAVTHHDFNLIAPPV